ncbi:MAG: hypothetical protein KC438_13270 [Thermomicrobiales bacterium]|nr:hypothetical protein [Thermomicrobiales bacterium]
MVVPLPDWLMDQGKASLATLFDRTCSVIRTTQVSNGAGGTIEASSTVGTYSCSIGPVRARSGEDLEPRGVVEVTTDQQVTLPLNADVLITDKLAIDGVEFDIVGVSMPASIEFVKTVIVRRPG